MSFVEENLRPGLHRKQSEAGRRVFLGYGGFEGT